jgi:hypothetical protein
MIFGNPVITRLWFVDVDPFVNVVVCLGPPKFSGPDGFVGFHLFEQITADFVPPLNLIGIILRLLGQGMSKAMVATVAICRWVIDRLHMRKHPKW